MGAAIGALAGGCRLQLTDIGRTMSVHARQRVRTEGDSASAALQRKSNIKRVDRLLGNKALWSSLDRCWGAIAVPALRAEKRPLLLIDWTGGCEGSRLWALSVSLAAEGRAIRIFEDVVPVRRLDCPRWRMSFLLRLRALVPAGCQPILVADAGFRIPFLKQLNVLGWDYVVRVRGRVYVATPKTKAVYARTFLKRATTTARSLGPLCLGKGQYLCAEGVLFRGKRKGRKAMSRKGSQLLWNHSRHYARAARDGWLLATSLQELTAEQIKAIYERRMQCEQSFRDLKNTRLGMGLAQSRTRMPKRLAVLCFLGALASLVLYRIGLRNRDTRWARSIQANTERRREVFSAVRLGLLVFEELTDAIKAGVLTRFPAPS